MGGPQQGDVHKGEVVHGPPPGPVWNVTGLDLSKMPTDSKGPALFGAQAGLTIFSFFVLLFRLYIRYFIVKNPGLDDLFICCGWITLTAVTTLMCIGVAKFDLGKHAWIATTAHLLDYQRVQMQVIWLHQWALIFTRISILTFYLRLSSQKWFRFLVFTVIGLNLGWQVTTLIVSVNVCNPPRKLWQPWIAGTCLNPVPWYIGTATVNILLDILVYITPFPMLRQLQVSGKQKIGLYITFGIGFFACTSSVMRVPALVKLLKTDDFLYDLYDICLWSTVELNAGILCASIPTFRALLKTKRTESTKGYSNTGGSSFFSRGKSNVEQSVLKSQDGMGGAGNVAYSLSYVQQRKGKDSEEEIIVPKGCISAKTDINVYTEERSIHDEEEAVEYNGKKETKY